MEEQSGGIYRGWKDVEEWEVRDKAGGDGV